MKPLMILQLLSLFLSLSTSIQQVPCKCINGGKCDPIQFDSKCQCPLQFIGQTCHLQATLLSSQKIDPQLSTNYSYFYFIPDEVNYYKMTFNICMLKNPSKSNTIFYIETQRNDGSLREIPSLFQTAKIVLQENQCTSFSTHYISAKQKQDQKFRKIIFGLKVMEIGDADQYLNTYFKRQGQISQKILSNLQQDKSQKIQNISIKMSYQVYLQPSYVGTFAVLFTSFILLTILVSFITYIKRKYTMNALDIDSLQELYRLARSLHRLQRSTNPQQFHSRSFHKFNSHNIQIFMPVSHYGNIQNTLQPQSLNNQQQSQAQTCSICLLQFESEDEIRTTPCKHRYHRECIDHWFQNQSSCPMCRRRLQFRSQIRELYYQFLRNELNV